jgi:predicted anti-sigma-YlaC factor YlaD
MKNHLTSDQLVDRLYSVAEDGHLEGCSECRERFRQLRERRAMAVEAVPESHEFLAAQRRNIYARMGERPQARMKWVPALAAAACLAAVGVVAYHPAQMASQMAPQVASQAGRPEIDDAQLFSEVYSMEQSTEPIAAKPIHAIFEQDQQ